MLKQVFRCPICRKTLMNPEELRLHRRNIHKGDYFLRIVPQRRKLVVV